MSGIEKEPRSETSIDAKLGEVKGVFEGVLIEMSAEINDTEALPTNVHVQGGMIRQRDRDLVQLRKMQRRYVAMRDRIYGILGIEIPAEDEASDPK